MQKPGAEEIDNVLALSPASDLERSKDLIDEAASLINRLRPEGKAPLS
jgi:hypothetical protein